MLFFTVVLLWYIMCFNFLLSNTLKKNYVERKPRVCEGLSKFMDTGTAMSRNLASDPQGVVKPPPVSTVRLKGIAKPSSAPSANVDSVQKMATVLSSSGCLQLKTPLTDTASESSQTIFLIPLIPNPTSLLSNVMTPHCSVVCNKARLPGLLNILNTLNFPAAAVLHQECLDIHWSCVFHVDIYSFESHSMHTNSYSLDLECFLEAHVLMRRCQVVLLGNGRTFRRSYLFENLVHALEGNIGTLTIAFWPPKASLATCSNCGIICYCRPKAIGAAHHGL